MATSGMPASLIIGTSTASINDSKSLLSLSISGYCSSAKSCIFLLLNYIFSQWMNFSLAMLIRSNIWLMLGLFAFKFRGFLIICSCTDALVYINKLRNKVESFVVIFIYSFNLFHSGFLFKTRLSTPVTDYLLPHGCAAERWLGISRALFSLRKCYCCILTKFTAMVTLLRRFPVSCQVEVVLPYTGTSRSIS